MMISSSVALHMYGSRIKTRHERLEWAPSWAGWGAARWGVSSLCDITKGLFPKHCLFHTLPRSRQSLTFQGLTLLWKTWSEFCLKRDLSSLHIECTCKVPAGISKCSTASGASFQGKGGPDTFRFAVSVDDGQMDTQASTCEDVLKEGRGNEEEVKC